MCALVLTRRQLNNQPVHGIGYLDLAAEATVVLNIVRDSQHILLFFVGTTAQFTVDKYMSRCACAVTAAVAINTRHSVVQGDRHQCFARVRVNAMFGSIVRDISNTDH